MSDLIALRAIFPVWDAIGHGTERYVHDPDGIVHVPRRAAVYLLHNAGYVIHDRQTPSDKHVVYDDPERE
ncbi:MAG: hypothetical protein JO139_10385 [Alphaproteobacteria bacterium]|nr:hypothetical protein [Alphaproteobacteria bacterium]MBV8337561.1 hypothetical protein [Alphaproteobacteria bacterium]